MAFMSALIIFIVYVVMVMLVFFLLGFIVPSSSGLAVLAMPIFAPLADAVGIDRYTIVCAYNWGQYAMLYLAPTGLVMEPADSTLQAYFAGEPAMLRRFVVERKSMENWGFPLPKDSVFLAEQRSFWDSLSREITWQHESVPYRPDGIAGDPVPYRFRNDDFVTSALMLSFFLLVWVMASSWRFLREVAKDFFYHRLRPNLFTDRANTVLRGRFFLVAQACFMQGILFFDYTQKQQPEVFAQVSPYTLLGRSDKIVVAKAIKFASSAQYSQISPSHTAPQMRHLCSPRTASSILCAKFSPRKEFCTLT